MRAPLPDEPGKIRRCSYLLESRGGGDLLLASVLQEACGGGRLACDLSVSLHALEREGGEEPLVEWARRDDGTSMLGDDVLFLGFPGSFAVDVARFGGEVSGGTAYFVMDNDSGGQTEEPCRVYSFHDGAATLVETLPPGWHDARYLRSGGEVRRPAAAAPGGDLSPKVDNSGLREMFSKHGKVAGRRKGRVRQARRGDREGWGS
ncbi:hypothetical protein C2845_PM06G29060 [Panicum miliaceum]|uniref:Uncharacterized protein n=1 Tax=Panicum miliaceum TaxID=4540 RepID=A0A3L6RAP2_PANMI|nr:hypothetical protein C2845_PM06G29060 [Panicum miliaceum]